MQIILTRPPSASHLFPRASTTIFAKTFTLRQFRTRNGRRLLCTDKIAIGTWLTLRTLKVDHFSVDVQPCDFVCSLQFSYETHSVSPNITKGLQEPRCNNFRTLKLLLATVSIRALRGFVLLHSAFLRNLSSTGVDLKLVLRNDNLVLFINWLRHRYLNIAGTLEGNEKDLRG